MFRRAFNTAPLPLSLSLQFGGVKATRDVSLTIFSQFQEATLSASSGNSSSANLTLVAGNGKSSVIDLVNPSDIFNGGPHTLRIKTRPANAIVKEQTMDVVDGQCWEATMADSVGSNAGQVRVGFAADGKLQQCEHLLMRLRPWPKPAVGIADLNVSGSGPSPPPPALLPRPRHLPVSQRNCLRA